MIPKYSTEAEKAVLGSMLARPDLVVDEVTQKLNRNDFFIPAHQEVFEAIRSLHEQRSGIDITTLNHWLENRKLAEVCGSPGILAELAAGLATHLNVGSYIAIVKDKSVLRKLQYACTAINDAMEEGEESVPAIMDLAEREIFGIIGDPTRIGKGVCALSDAVKSALNRLDAIRQRKGETIGIPSGMRKLDAMTLGWQRGQMIVLAARPGIGKTAMALQWARKAAYSRWNYDQKAFDYPGYSVGIQELEMTNEAMTDRILSAAASIKLRSIKLGQISDEERQKLEIIAEDLQSYPIFLDDEPALSLGILRAKARRLKKDHKIDLLIIDYLQLMTSESEKWNRSRENEVAEISRGIKSLAKELGIPIIVLAQLNRKSAEKNEEPGLHNLRESGAIEQDADVVILLHRDDDGLYKAIIPKIRDGPTDTIDLEFDGSTQTFNESEPVKQPVTYQAPYQD